MRQFTEDRRKFKELILYISQQSESDPNYGSTLLNKLLFFADFLAYAKFGTPITGAEYMRELHGPVPRPVRTPVRVLSEMVRAGELRLRQTPLPRSMTLVTPIALRQPDMSMFSDEERDLVDAVIGSFKGWTAGKISKYTHEFVLWQSVALNETIPYETIFVSPNQRLTDREVRYGQEIARKRGWLKESGRS